MDKKPLFDNVPDEQLGSLIHQLLIVEGHEEVEIQHRTEGHKVLTKENYKKILASIVKIKKMSPAKRLIEENRIKTAHQIKHRTAMLTAKTFIVDVEDEENFGCDIDGNKIGLELMAFVPVNQYLKGVTVKKGEIGAFVHPENEKPPLRILNSKEI